MGIYILNVNSTCLINAINLDPTETVMLQDYKANIQLKENDNLSYFEYCKLLFHIFASSNCKK